MSEYPPEDEPTRPTPIVAPEEPTRILPAVPVEEAVPAPAERSEGWSFELKLATLAAVVLLVGGLAALWANSSSTSTPDAPQTLPNRLPSGPTATTRPPSTTAQSADTPALITVATPPPAAPAAPAPTSHPAPAPSPRPTTPRPAPAPPPPRPTTPVPTTVAPTTTPPTAPPTT
jgi:hypothetical protein